MVGYAIEAFVFGYLGLTFFAYEGHDWSFRLILAELLIIIIGRFSSIIGVFKFLEYEFSIFIFLDFLDINQELV